RRMFRHIGRGAAVLAAERKTLHQAQRHHQDGREPTYRRERRQQADEERRCPHKDDRHKEGVLPSHQVADAAEDERAEWSHQKAGGIRGEGGKQRRGLVAGREEQRREERREHRVQVEVVPLEYRAEGRGEDDSPLLSPEAAYRFFFEHSLFGRCVRHLLAPLSIVDGKNPPGAAVLAPRLWPPNLTRDLRSLFRDCALHRTIAGSGAAQVPSSCLILLKRSRVEKGLVMYRSAPASRPRATSASRPFAESM